MKREPGYYIVQLEYWDEKTVIELEKVGDELQVFVIGDDESYMFKNDMISRRGSSDSMEIKFFSKVKV